jgi:hypothetical protein
VSVNIAHKSGSGPCSAAFADVFLAADAPAERPAIRHGSAPTLAPSDRGQCPLRIGRERGDRARHCESDATRPNTAVRHETRRYRPAIPPNTADPRYDAGEFVSAWACEWRRYASPEGGPCSRRTAPLWESRVYAGLLPEPDAPRELASVRQLPRFVTRSA